MAVVGEAHILVRAITTGVKKDIEKGFNGISGSTSRAGKTAGAKFASAFKGTQGGIFDKLKAGLNSVGNEARAASKNWQALQKKGFVLQSVMGALAGSAGSLVGALGSVAGVAGAAAASSVALVGTFVSLKLAAMAAKIALSGVGAAVSALWKQQAKSDKAEKASIRQIRDARRNLAKVIANNREQIVKANQEIEKSQIALTKAFEDAQEEVQQLGFDAEDAAINEKKAALELERARETLIRVQDLPPNSRARREAELAFQEAELNYRRAVDANSDLAKEQQRIAGDPKNTQGYIDAAQEVADNQENLSKIVVENIQEEIEARERLQDAIEDSANSDSAGADPLAGLTESQRAFALYLAGLKPVLDGLKESVAKGFLPELETQMRRIIDSKAFDEINIGLEKLGVSLGIASRNFTDKFLDPRNVQSMAQVFETASVVTEKFGTIAGTAFGIIVTSLDAADPLIRRFVDFIDNKLGIFDEFLKTKNASGELTTFFNQVGDLVANLGPVFGNIFTGLSALIADAVTPGSGAYMLLEWLKTATEGFANLGDDPGGLREFLQGATTNAISMFSSVGALLGEIIALGADPNIKLFWDTLKEGAPFMGQILENGLAAAPSLATLIVNITKIVSAFADAGAPKAFFDTLAAVAGKVAEFFNYEPVKAFLDAIGPLLGTFLAIGTIVTVATEVILTIIGTMLVLWDKIKLIWDIVKLVGTAIQLAFTANPIGLIIAAVALLVGALVWFFTQTETGKEMWANFTQFLGEAWNNVVIWFQEVGQGFVDFFTGMWEGLKTVFQPVIDFFVAYITTAFNIIKGIIDVFIAIFTIIFVGFGTVVQGIWDGIQTGFQLLSDALKPILDGIKAFFDPIFKGIGTFVDGIWTGIRTGFQKFHDWIKPVIDKIGGFFDSTFGEVEKFFKKTMNTMIGFAEGFVNFFIDGLNGIIDKINTIKLKIPDIMKPLFGGKSEIGFNLNRVARISLPRLAEGGVARATNGGILAQIAEGGRNERIEPLDPNGLSARDKAMIELLAGRGSNGGQPIQIIVNPAPGMNERELATAVSRQLAIQMRKGSIA